MKNKNIKELAKDPITLKFLIDLLINLNNEDGKNILI